MQIYFPVMKLSQESLNKWRPYDMSWKKSNYVGIDYDDASVKHRSNNNKFFIENAVNVAKKSSMLHKHGCVVVYKNKIISVGHNHCIVACSFSIHAEMDAINKAKKILSRVDMQRCTLFVVRIGQDSMDNPLKYSKPCPTCSRSIVDIGIKKTYYSTNFERDSLQGICKIC